MNQCMHCAAFLLTSQKLLRQLGNPCITAPSWADIRWFSVLLWRGLLSRFYLTKLYGSTTLLCSILLPCSGKRLFEVVGDCFLLPCASRWRDSSLSACRRPTQLEQGLRLPDRPLCCGCLPLPIVTEVVSVCFLTFTVDSQSSHLRQV